MSLDYPITTVVTPAATYDLTDLATVKGELKLPTADTGNDDFLGRAISEASFIISNYCDRVFPPETVEDLFYRKLRGPMPLRSVDASRLQLSRWPVISISSIVETDWVGNVTTLVVDVDFKIDAARGVLIRLNSDTLFPRAWFAENIAVIYSAGFSRPVVNEAATVPISPGPYNVTVAQASNFFADGGVVYAGSLIALVAVASSPTAGQYSVSASGVYTFSAADGGVGVLISYLFAALPADLIQAALRLVTARFKAQGRDPMLRTEGEPGIGQTQYWVGPVSGQDGSVSPDIAGILDKYRVPVSA